MTDIIDKAKEEVIETKQAIFSETITLVNGAFALVAALAWNEAVKALIDRYFKAGTGLYSHFIYAIIITLIAVFITTRLSRFKKTSGGRETANSLRE